jgi:8-oxo-dGTP pyrophosphatase MutT (NUDIX family)
VAAGRPPGRVHVSRLLARVQDATPAPGSRASVELWLSTVAVAENIVFAAIVVLDDAHGRYAVVFSPRRDEWGAPGGWREEGESVADCAVREVLEETGLQVPPPDLRAVGYEIFDPPPSRPGGPVGRHCLQVFQARAGGGFALASSTPDAVDPAWVTGLQLEQLCGRQFWWPLVDAVVRRT